MTCSLRHHMSALGISFDAAPISRAAPPPAFPSAIYTTSRPAPRCLGGRDVRRRCRRVRELSFVLRPALDARPRLMGYRHPTSAQRPARSGNELRRYGTMLYWYSKEWVTRGRFRHYQVKKDAVKALCRRTISTWTCLLTLCLFTRLPPLHYHALELPFHLFISASDLCLTIQGARWCI
jgi:hypothetical protein